MIKNADYDAGPNGVFNLFGAELLNFSLHLPQFGRCVENDVPQTRGARSSTNYTYSNGHYNHSTFYFNNNGQDIAAGVTNTVWFARSDIHMTDFIVVPKEDINIMRSLNKGFTNAGNNLHGNYKKTSGSNFAYFYKGIGASNCINYLYNLGIV